MSKKGGNGKIERTGEVTSAAPRCTVAFADGFNSIGDLFQGIRLAVLDGLENRLKPSVVANTFAGTRQMVHLVELGLKHSDAKGRGLKTPIQELLG
jgi:hypothetical protein